MKKTLALLLCLAMLFTALSVNVFAAETPAISVITHESSETGETTFAVELANFDSLKGFDLVVTATGGIEIVSASAVGTKTALAANENYTISDDKKTLHVVELTTATAGAIITVKANVTDDATIAVTASKLAKSGTELYATSTYEVKAGEVAAYVAPTTATQNDGTVAVPTDGTFVPYGAVFTGEATDPSFVAKNDDGTFTVAAEGTTVKTFKKPIGNFGTFGISDSLNGTAKQFGNYAENYNSANKYGTLIIVGDWATFRDYYLANSAYSDSELTAKIYNAYRNAIEGYDFVKFTAGTTEIKVYDVAQFNWMWKSESILEYAVRVSGLAEGETYSAVAYCVDTNNAVTMAKDIKSFTK